MNILTFCGFQPPLPRKHVHADAPKFRGVVCNVVASAGFRWCSRVLGRKTPMPLNLGALAISVACVAETEGGFRFGASENIRV